MIKKVKNLYEFLSDPNLCNKELARALLNAVKDAERDLKHKGDQAVLQTLAEVDDDGDEKIAFLPVYRALDKKFQTPELALMAVSGWGDDALKHTRLDLLRQHPELVKIAVQRGTGFGAVPQEFRTEELAYECFKVGPGETVEALLIGDAK
jgi:DNA polymerase III delta prime subunit